MPEKKKNWFRRHWILTTLIVLIVLVVIGSKTSRDSTAQSEVLSNQDNQEVQDDVWSKTSGYTVEECNQVCEEAYDLELQVGNCQGSCTGIYGKPSDSLDKYVNQVKETSKKTTSP